ncbi:hypothetical protein VTP01DRAFT_10585 [Rhizomucor pusillus]|uniref:uncharacterized protein n=1 Tax=Rhizomucor pusillus TaxID=4840 RepID=UPI0037440428
MIPTKIRRGTEYGNYYIDDIGKSFREVLPVNVRIECKSKVEVPGHFHGKRELAKSSRAAQQLLACTYH